MQRQRRPPPRLLDSSDVKSAMSMVLREKSCRIISPGFTRNLKNKTLGVYSCVPKHVPVERVCPTYIEHMAC